MGAYGLVIVESVNKVQKVQQYLNELYGKDKYLVSYSSGHIRDLPKNSFGLTEDYQPKYEYISGGANRVAELKKLHKQVQKVFLATDDDREGEAIAWHLDSVLGCNGQSARVAFNEITKTALKNTFDNPRSINMKLVVAQETRRFLDRIIGFVGTPAFTLICAEKQIAGRVQTCIVCYLADLENQIQQFVSTHHYGIKYLFNEWAASWDTSNFISEQNPYVLDKNIADKVANLKSFNVVSFEEKPVKSSPPAPFTTPTYLRAAQVQLKLKPKEAMKIAQELFADGHITYLRTDSPNISDTAFDMIHDFALKHNLPISQQHRKFKAKKSAQEGHEAIRPTDVSKSKVSENPIHQQVYQMIWLRAVASQMKDATYTARNARLKATEQFDGQDIFIKASGRKLIDQGWLRLTAKTNFSEQEVEDLGEEEQQLNNPVPLLQVGELQTAINSQVENKATQPPRRHSEASLIKFMEDSDVGRPSSYATIVSKIMDHGYVVSDNKSKLHATDLALRLNAKISDKFDFCDLKYTAGLEGQLDLIAHGENISKRLLKETHQTIINQSKNASEGLSRDPNAQYCSKCQSALVLMQSTTNGGTYFRCSNLDCSHLMQNKNGTAIDRESTYSQFNCTECGKPLIERESANGKFFGCSGYFNKRNKCNALYPATDDGQPDLEAYAKRKETFSSKNGGKPTTDSKPTAVKSPKTYNCTNCGKELTQRKGGTGDKKWEIWNCGCGLKWWGSRNKPDFTKAVKDRV